MDADLYEHLSTTITSKPLQQSPRDGHDSSASEDDAFASQDARDSNGSGGTGQRQRQRTMSASLPQEIDQVVHAISSSQWAARLGNLMDSVKKQVLALLWQYSSLLGWECL